MALRNLRIAVEGCGHGTLHSIYASVAKACNEKEWTDGVDVVIIGGDFQAVRNGADLECMAVPEKYRELGDFHEYYSGKRIAPYLTIFVGGNHEASNHLRELFYGGWVAPRIYYTGAANVLRLGNCRIAGMSGIWKGHDYKKPHFERIPYSFGDTKSAYHIREYDVRKLQQLRNQIDIGISHDWPRGVEWQGDHRLLFTWKSFLKEDADSGTLGSVAARYVLDYLRPRYWFSAHLHVKYAAIVNHGVRDKKQAAKATNGSHEMHKPNHTKVTLPTRNEDEIDLDIDDERVEPEISVAKEDKLNTANSGHGKNSDEIDLDLDNEGTDAPPNTKPETGAEVTDDLRSQLPASFQRPPPRATTSTDNPQDMPPDPPTNITNQETYFLALDKCLPRRHFLQLLEISQPQLSNETPSEKGDDSASQQPFRLSYDPEWLAITRVFARDAEFGNPCTAVLPHGRYRAHFRPLIEAEEEWVQQHITSQGKLVIPENFTVTAPVHDEAAVPGQTAVELREYNNPQTTEFCALVDIPNHFHAEEEEMLASAVTVVPRYGGQGGHAGGGRGGRGAGWGAGGRGGRGNSRGGGRGGGRGGYRDNRGSRGRIRGRGGRW